MGVLRVVAMCLVLCVVVAEGDPSRIRLSAQSLANHLHLTSALPPHSPEWELWGAHSHQPHEMVRFSLAMHHNADGLQRLDSVLQSVSDPSSPLYGRHWTSEDVMQLVNAPASHVNQIVAWLQHEGVQDIVQVSNSLRCQASVDVVQRLFGTELFHVASNPTDSASRRVTVYHGTLSVPAAVAPFIELVSGISLPGVAHGWQAMAHDASAGQPTPLAVWSSASAGKRRLLSATPLQQNISEPVQGSCPAATPTPCVDSFGKVFGCCGAIGQCCASAKTGPMCCKFGSVCCKQAGACAASCPPLVDSVVNPETLRTTYLAHDMFPASTPLSSVVDFANATRQLSQYSQSVVSLAADFSAPAFNLFGYGLGVVSETRVVGDGTGTQFSMPGVTDSCMQYMSSVSGGSPTWMWRAKDTSDAISAWAEDVLSSPSPRPTVFTLTAGEFVEQLTSGRDAEIIRANTELKKLAAVGITVISPSGNNGAPGASVNFPVDATGRNFPFSATPGYPSGENMCTQITLEVQTRQDPIVCHVPSTIQTSDRQSTLRCVVAFINPSCRALLEDYINASRAGSGAQQCGLELFEDDKAPPLVPLLRMYRVYTPRCSCAQLPSITSADGTCTIRGYAYSNTVSPALSPAFPASSPYVTSVGGTRLTHNSLPLCGQDVDSDKITCSQTDVAASIADRAFVTSGGGFSSLFPRPSWQSAAVNTYLSRAAAVLPPASVYNVSNRAYPDVSLVAHHLIVAKAQGNGQAKMAVMDGTSMAAASFAGMVSLLNTRLIANGRAPLGFLNPLLYQMAREFPSTFHDVTQGDNKCTRLVCSTWGFQALRGFDPVSGLGSPRLDRWLQYLDLTPRMHSQSPPTAAPTTAPTSAPTSAPTPGTTGAPNAATNSPDAPTWVKALVIVTFVLVLVLLAVVLRPWCARATVEDASRRPSYHPYKEQLLPDINPSDTHTDQHL